MGVTESNNREQKCLRVIVERTAQACITRANELGVTDEEYKDLIPGNSCFMLVYYR